MGTPSAPPLKITMRAYGATQAIAVAGELDFAVADQLAAAMRAALARTPETVLLDLSTVTFIDAAGARAVRNTHRHAQARSARMRIIPATDRVHRVFKLCGLEAVLPFAAAPAIDTHRPIGRHRESINGLSRGNHPGIAHRRQGHHAA